jgi:hypothetical protein
MASPNNQSLYEKLGKVLSVMAEAPAPGVATQTNSYRGLVQKIHRGIDYAHII